MTAVVALLLAAAWSGESATQAIDLTPLVPGTAAGFGQQVSDLFWNPQTRTLWVARAPGGVWALVEAGDGGFRVGAAYPGINSDSEGITQAALGDDAVFILDETGGFIRKYAVDGAGGATLLRAWNLAGVVPAQVGNAGPEGLAFVPDEALRDAGFPASAFDAGGLFFVAHQAGGFVYAVDLDPGSDLGRTQVATLATRNTETSALAFDRSSGRLYVSHNVGTNDLEVTALLRLADGGLRLQQLADFDSPNPSNLEGFAVTPQYAADGGAPPERWCFWADDDGNSVGRPGLMWFRQLPATLVKDLLADGQAALPFSAVATPPSVLLRDAFLNPYTGQQVTFTPALGGGAVVGGSALTSASGVAAVGAWTLGAGGPQQLSVSAPGFSPAVVFTATVLDAGATADAGLDGGMDAGPDAGVAADGGTTAEVPRGCGCAAAPAAWPLGALLLMAARGRRRR